MTHENDKTSDPSPQQEPSRILSHETLGEFLRKTRIGNGIDIARLSQKTRIHADYIQSIERDEYNKLPGDTYRKLFIKSIAKVLELDQEEVYARFLKEHPEAVPLPSPEEQLLQKKTDNSSIDNKSLPVAPSQSSSTGFLGKRLVPFFILLVVATAIFFLIPEAEKESPPLVLPAVDTVSQMDSVPAISPDSIAAVNDSTTIDSVTSDTLSDVVQDPLVGKLPEITKRYKDETGGKLEAEVICSKGQLTISSFRNGQAWSNSFLPGNAKKFSADTALYIRILGDGEGVLVYKGTIIPLKPEPNRFVLRIDAKGHEWTTLKVWTSVSGKK